MQLEIDALKEAAAWPGADQRTLVVLASQLMAAELCQEGFGYFAARSDAAPAGALSLALAGAFEPASTAGPGRQSPNWRRPPASIPGCRTTSGEPRWPGSPAPRLRRLTALRSSSTTLITRQDAAPWAASRAAHGTSGIAVVVTR